jgi:hypothetical protein
MSGSGCVVFFDIGETLGVATGFDEQFRLSGLKLYPHVRAVLERLRLLSCRVGIISNTSTFETTENMRRVLEAAGIYDIFDAGLLLYSGVIGLRKDSPRIFSHAVELAGLADHPAGCLFVGEDPGEGAFARAAGMRYVPHPLLVEEVLDDQPLRFVKVKVPVGEEARVWAPVLSNLPLVPLRVTGEGRTITYAMTSTRVAARLDDLGFEVTRLGALGAPEHSRLYLIRDDRSRRTGFLVEAGQSALFLGQQAEWLLESSGDGLIVALPIGERIDNYHFKEALHGHTVRLTPDPALLRPFGNAHNALATTWMRRSPVPATLSEKDREALACIRPDIIERHLMRYSHASSPSAEEGLQSRHIAHPHNVVAVERAVEDFKALGLAVHQHVFIHEGRTLVNVEAELPGQSDELVLVTAHLDSTAAFDGPGYDPATDPAPGADDDASGMSAVLVIAASIVAAAAHEPLNRTVRFVLFNAEEQGLAGSQAYARDMAAFDTPIVAVFQMDMIGYRGGQDAVPRPFEVHIGYPSDPDVEERSLPLTERIQALVANVSPGLRPPQIYRANDPAAGRSDHGSFHDRGYAACVTSEDFFAGPQPESPEAQPNPNYHQHDDRFVNGDYAADIARVVGAAALLTPRG